MKKFKAYLKTLNWFGFGCMFFICMLGLASNKSVNSVGQWAIMMLIFGLPICLCVLFTTEGH